jgi:hypothetical protein
MVYASEFRQGSCIQNFVYLKMSSVLNRSKNKSILKNKPPEVKIMWNFITPKVNEFRNMEFRVILRIF